MNTVTQNQSPFTHEHARHSVFILYSAINKMAQGIPGLLTQVHVHFVYLAMHFKAYSLACRVLDLGVFDIGHGQATFVNPEQYLLYFYYAAAVRIGLKQWDRAIANLLLVLTPPTVAVSAIQMDAYKKYVLVNLRCSGVVPALPKYTSSCINKMAKMKGYCSELVEAWGSDQANALSEKIQKNADRIEKDNNTGLCEQLLEAHKRNIVKDLTNTYLSLSLTELAQNVGMEINEATQLLVGMVATGEVQAVIDVQQDVREILKTATISKC